jgi:hypothetical protein
MKPDQEATLGAAYDTVSPTTEADARAEVKVRGNGFGQLYEWLTDRDVLIVHTDRQEPLVVLPVRLAADIAAIADRAKGATS